MQASKSNRSPHAGYAECAGLLLILSMPLGAQTPPGEVTVREETPTFQSSVSLVRVPVVVRDKQGHAVGALRKEDFQLADHGKPQYISQFSLEGSAVPKPAAQAPAQLAVPGEPAAAQPKFVAPTRFVAYVFDDFHLKMEDLMSVRQAALKHIEHGIPPEERIALLELSGRVQTQFTDDVEKFRAALMKVMPVTGRHFYPPVNRFQAMFFRDFSDDVPGATGPLAVQTMLVHDCLNVTYGAADFAKGDLSMASAETYADDANAFRGFNDVVRLMSGMPGDRVMVLVSPGMYVSSELKDRYDDLINRAVRAGVVVNTLDARGVYVVDAASELAGCGGLGPDTLRAVEQYYRQEGVVNSLFLTDLAQATGGASAAQNDFQAEFDRLATPPEFIYYLGFYPQELKPDGKFHEIKVKLPTAKGLTLTARKGYWAPSRDEDAAATATREIGEAVFSRDEVHDLPIDIHTEFYKTTAWDAKATVVSHLDLRRLPLRKQDDRNRDDVTVVCAVFDRNGNFVKGSQSVVEIRLKDESVESRHARAVTLHHEFDLKSGDYLVRVVARDAEGKQMAAVNGVVEIP